MVTDRKKQLTDTIEVIVNLVRVVQLRRAIQDASPEMHLSFWILINNSLTRHRGSGLVQAVWVG